MSANPPRGLVVALVGDLLLASRIEEACRTAGRAYRRVDSLIGLPSPAGVDLLLVAWDERQPDWPDALRDWRELAPAPIRVILFGPHTDLAAHAEARAAGLGPMWARSRLLAELPGILAPR